VNGESSDREWILSRLKQAERHPFVADPVEPNTAAADWDLFRDSFLALGGHWLESLCDFVWPRTAVADDDVADFLPGSVERIDDPWEADVGVTMVDLAVAETGSLLIGNLPGRRRLHSLAPPIHLAICRRDALVASLGDAMRSLPERTAVFVSGPSRTADIEGVLVRGVHGPRELWLAVIDP
jgi:hypothetical protein